MSKPKNQDQESANATTPAAHKAGSAPRQKERNNFIVMPSSLAFHNACNDPCDMLIGPCVCGAWHRLEDLPYRIFNQLKAEPTVNNYQRALAAIDLIVGDDFCEELDMSNMHRKLRGRLATAHKKLSTIYMIAHAEVPSHSCHHVHDDWRKLKDQILKEANQ